jgi:STE24 endopeptidase
LLVAGAIAIPLTVVLYALIVRVESWWIPAAVGSGALILVLTVLGPVMIAPLFNTFTKLPESPLRGKIGAMARESGMTVEDVYVMDASRRTRGGNAYVTGLGRTKRIVLYDTLLRDMTFEEAVSVVAHELGHWNRKHLWIQIWLAAASSLAGFAAAGILLRMASNREWFGIARPDDPAGLPFLLLVGMVLSLAVLPVDRALSRTMERQADWSSLLIAGGNEGFIALERRLALMNKGDITPPGWVRTILASHPPVLERIGMAEEWKNGELVNR